jgi:predicted nucleic acid-binding protein
MSGNGVLLDSVILIDHFNGIVAATEYLHSVGRTAHISAITRAEVLTGLIGDARRNAARFLDCFRFLPLDREIADLAAELRSLHRWKLPDAFQAAVAKRHDLQLATRNTADFDPKRQAFVVVPYNS